jgi:hypothetical protein
MFSKTQRKAIQEKVEQLRKVKAGILSVRELTNLVTERRVAWMKEHKDELLAKYSGLPLEEIAWRVVCFDHMDINPEHSRMTRVSDRKIRIDSYNFCPYLEACQQLGLDTIRICKEVGEPAIQKMIEVIDPRLKFSRNYSNIRPYSTYCEEYFEIL